MINHHMKNVPVCQKLLHLLVEKLNGHGVWTMPLDRTDRDPSEEFNAFSISNRRTVKLADIEALFTPVYQCRDYADGWITFESFDEAIKYHDETGALIRVRPAEPAE